MHCTQVYTSGVHAIGSLFGEEGESLLLIVRQAVLLDRDEDRVGLAGPRSPFALRYNRGAVVFP
jgi:hypothetical protein